ncbi:hypothetical protein JCM16777_1929 [Leptotrichia wadei]|uniref:KilA-N DNA-binding domain-containing protein n=1 Tax=Leptotrichia wadei TaxID=157687 RepID=A0A7U6LC42_9FUSO|nr:ORF6N domain-containing protein [Leptotrichia wadei]BBM43666.1 hypothetical protein JCM16777_1929 [Leptotrichia wadei]
MKELAILAGNNKIMINGIEIETKEYKGQRVITAWDIAKLHEREPREITQNFKYIKDKMILGLDYFTISRNEISKSKIMIQDFIPNNVKKIQLFTERGYLKLTKTFTDELSWKIQDMLVESYFIVVTGKIQPKQLTKIEVLKMALETELENERLRNENKAQCEIIKGLNGELEPYQLEDIINRIIRATGGNYGAKYNEVYRVFKERYHIDLKTRMTNYNKTVRAKDRFKSVLKYALANNYGKDLLNVVTTLFPESVRIVMDGINQNTGLGKDEPLLLD